MSGITGTSGISGLTGGNLLTPPEPVLSPTEWATDKLTDLKAHLDNLADGEPLDPALMAEELRGASREVTKVLEALT